MCRLCSPGNYAFPMKDEAEQAVSPWRRAPLQTAHELAQAREVAPADFEHVGSTVDLDEDAAVVASDEAGHAVACDQAVAVDAHEVVAELVFEALERVLDENLPLGVVDYDIFVLCLQVEDVLHRHEYEIAAHACADMTALAVRAERAGDPVDLVRAEPARAREGLIQPLAPHRLEHVVDGVRLERLQRVFVVSAAEHHGRRVV